MTPSIRLLFGRLFLLLLVLSRRLVLRVLSVVAKGLLWPIVVLELDLLLMVVYWGQSPALQVVLYLPGLQSTERTCLVFSCAILYCFSLLPEILRSWW